ncbi:MAG: DUF5706 domain-containing protein [Bacteroidia bacterium]
MQDLDTILITIYDQNKDWLKHGEAKNTGLIGFNFAIAGGLAALTTQPDIYPGIRWYLIGVIVLLVCAAGLGMLSMVPILKQRRNNALQNENSSVIYFSDIANNFPSSKDYLEKLLQYTGASTGQFTDYQVDIATQILQLAAITRHKHNIFAIAMWISITAVCSPVISLPLILVRTIAPR